MAKSLSMALVAMLTVAAPSWAGLLLYDGFEYTPDVKLAEWVGTAGSPNDQYNVAYDQYWRYAGLGGKYGGPDNAPGVVEGTLSVPGMPAGVGNSVKCDITQAGTARIGIPGGAKNTGTMYWSGMLRVNAVNDLTTLPTGLLVAAFNNSTGAQQTSPTSLGSLLKIRKDANDPAKYVIGTGVNNVTANLVFDTAAPISAGQTVFLVASYTYNAGPGNDVARMWINPDPLTFGAAVEPTATLSGGPGANAELGQVASFNLRNVNTVGDPDFQFDELRVGDSWASVTPEPASLILLGLGLFALPKRRRA
jgi:hypothetical protein